MASPVPSLKHPESVRQRHVMVTFRVLCAVVMAWALNWVMGQPVAAALLEEVPEMAHLAPLAAAIIGFVALSKRQGWGFIVAAANGVWAMILTVGLAWLIFLTVTLFDHILHGLIDDFENFLRILGSETEPLAEGWIDLRLLGMTLAATIVASLVTEALHWVLVRLRRERGEEGEGQEGEAEQA